MGKKRKLNWKPVSLSESMISKGIEGLIGIEELSEYSIVKNEIATSGPAPKKRKETKIEKTISKECLQVSEDSVQSHNSGVWSVTPVKQQSERNNRNHLKRQKGDKKADIAGRRKLQGGLLVRKNPVLSPQKTNLKKGTKLEESIERNINDKVPKGMESWSMYKLQWPILRALSDLGFKNPTQIQASTLPASIMGRRDILGAAETGSGKTLAFGIPIIYGILEQKKKMAENKINSKDNQRISEEVVTENVNDMENLHELSDDDCVDSDDEEITCPSEKKLYALILTPTRELAIQVKSHLVAVAKYTGIKIATVIGGLASQKQERLLKKRPEIVVATPGRLWEMIENGNPHLERVSDISFLAIDETDRMLEKGHFQELQTLLELINKDEFKKRRRQNFVFSATLTLVHEPPKYASKPHQQKRITPGQKLQQVISSLGITNPKVVDITLERGTSGTLSEARIVCSINEKDYYLYYFIHRHPGRTLVFCNSISCVRRLAQILEILQCKPYPLHANMQQRQRLKNLERFRDNSSGLLLATDVAARGLDIPNVQHVIHYQVPRSTESYVHRSGRTARAQKEGITVLLMEPSEVSFYLRLCRNLGRGHDLPDFPVEDDLFSAVKSRVDLARQIDRLEHSSRKTNSQHAWFQKAAKDMDLLVDEDEFPQKMDDEVSVQVKRQINGLKKQLNGLLGKPVIPKFTSASFPHQGVTNTKTDSALAVISEKRKKGRFVKIRK